MIQITIGLQFGDEGKGLFTDYLCSKTPSPIVIRFNGGHQAGHTVWKDNKTPHTFSCFGSGSFRDVPTYWSKYCTVEPIKLMDEFYTLKDKGVIPKLFIDEKCPITTPFERILNQSPSRDLGHGTCGVGFGDTIDREEKHYSITAFDLLYPKILKHKVGNLANFYGLRDVDLREFYFTCNELIGKHTIKIVDWCGNLPLWHNCIFEGAQGLLLDQNNGFFPNVTRSNTGTKNIMSMLASNKNLDQELDLYLVTRAYQTRHGNGFMTNENIPHNIKIDPLENNQDNKYQGGFRRSVLDLDLLEYAIHKDTLLNNNYDSHLVITCLDHIKDEYIFTHKGNIIQCLDDVDFCHEIAETLNIDSVFMSSSTNSTNIVEL